MSESPKVHAVVPMERLRELLAQSGDEEDRAILGMAMASLDLRAALSNLVRVIESAGLLNLSKGVPLGATSWYAKASDRVDRAKAALDLSPPLPPQEGE